MKCQKMKHVIVFGLLCLCLSGCTETNQAAENPSSETVKEQSTIMPQEATSESAEAETSKSEATPESSTAEIAMDPYSEDLIGAKGGYIFVPINGETYRYDNGTGPKGTATIKELLFEFFDNPIGADGYGYEYKIYSLEEFPKFELLMATITDVKDGLTETVYLTYKPLEKTSNPSELASAIADGIFVIKQGKPYANEDMWLSFYEKTSEGLSASVIIGYYYEMPANASQDYSAANQNDYPLMFYKTLEYDGTGYCISPVHKIDGKYVIHEEVGYDSPASTWKYLMHYTGTPRPGSADKRFTQYEGYVLTDDNTVTWDDIELDTVNCLWTIRNDKIYLEYK